jgi:diguanylate cyclase (GGDEF)-like protein
VIHLFAIVLVIAGAVLIIIALNPIRQLIAQLPDGPLRRRWFILRTLIVSFIIGYLGYIVAHWNSYGMPEDLVVPGVFFLGGWFVLLVSFLSLQTAVDVRRMVLLEQENITDPLTGIFNRRYLERRLTEEIAMSRRYNLPLSVLMVDIDHFKSINDTCGHLEGDLVLHRLAKLAAHTVRETDVVARYGGEEILVIAPNTMINTAETLAERLRVEILVASLLSPDVQTDPPRNVTVSIGVACFNQETHGIRDLINRADEALYRAKGGGRNRVAVNG